MEQAIASRDEWLKARRALLKAEKAHTRAGDALAAKRRALPRQPVTKRYEFNGAEGRVTLDRVFNGLSQLVIYHFMFGTDWSEGCASCSFWADHFDGLGRHLAARDTAFAVISKAPYDKLASYKARMHWQFRWLSAAESDFNADFNVSFTPEQVAAKTTFYNYRDGGFGGQEAPGISVFERDGNGGILHSYSAYGRGLEAMNGTYHILDLTPKGRNEAGLDWPMQWVRRHDQYA